jgi:hypothetical protein
MTRKVTRRWPWGEGGPGLASSVQTDARPRHGRTKDDIRPFEIRLVEASSLFRKLPTIETRRTSRFNRKCIQFSKVRSLMTPTLGLEPGVRNAEPDGCASTEVTSL